MPNDMPIATVECDELARHIDAGDAFVLDVRKHAHDAQIYGSIRYDPKKLDKAERLILPLPKEDGMVVLYDEDGKSDALCDLAAKVRDNGYGRVSVLLGGFEAWKQAEGRTEDPTLEQMVPLVSDNQIER
jgi:rhodanese-related sulfurtransferase